MQQTKSRLGEILVGGTGYSFAQGSLAQGQMTESALRALSRDYRNQRRHVYRHQSRRGGICKKVGGQNDYIRTPPSAVPAPPPKHYRGPNVGQKRRNPEPANDTNDEADERYSSKYRLCNAAVRPEDRPKGSAAGAHSLQGLLGHSPAPSLASNVTTSTVARAYSARPIQGVNRTAAAKAPCFALPPPLRLDQRERAAPSVLVPSPHVPIHGQKKRNAEQATDNDNAEAGGFRVKRRLQVPPSTVPLYRRCPATRSSSLFTRIVIQAACYSLQSRHQPKEHRASQS